MTVPTAELRAALAAALGPVVRLERQASPYASTAALEDLEVELADGTGCRLVLKTGAPGVLRETALYRDVLAGAGLGTPELVAASNRHGGWLVLRAVGGVPLWQSPQVEAWCAVARWLAGAHRRLAPSTGRMGAAVGTSYGRQLERAVARDPRAAMLAGIYADAVASLTADTVVHGELFPSNILLGQAAEPHVVDWETAGDGCGLTDLAALLAGWDPATAGQIADAYGGDLVLLPAARLVVAVRWLGEPTPVATAGGGRARGTDWWAEAAGAAASMTGDPRSTGLR